MVVAAPVIAPQAATAQKYSSGYEFLKAVAEKNGEAVIAALSDPSSQIVNSRDRSTGKSALHLVVQRRDGAWVRFLLSHNANPNLADKDGVTPLQLAVQLGFREGVEALVARGARLDVTNVAGETPLISAVHRDDGALVKILLAAGADPDRADNSGRTARDYAGYRPGSAAAAALAANDAEPRTVTPTYGPGL